MLARIASIALHGRDDLPIGGQVVVVQTFGPGEPFAARSADRRIRRTPTSRTNSFEHFDAVAALAALAPRLDEPCRCSDC